MLYIRKWLFAQVGPPLKLQDIDTESDVHTAEAILDSTELRSLAVDDANINHVVE